MILNKLKRPQIGATTNIDLQIVEKLVGSEGMTQLAEPLGPINYQELSEEAIRKINSIAVYNGISDSLEVLDEGTVPASLTEAEMRALMRYNRERAAFLTAKIETLNRGVLEAIRSTPRLAVPYNPTIDLDIVAGMQTAFGEDVPLGSIDNVQYLELLDKERKASRAIAAEMNKDNNGNISAEVTIGSPYQYPIDHYENNVADSSDTDIVNPATGYVMLSGSIAGAAETAEFVNQTLRSLDEQGSYIESVINRSPDSEINIQVAGMNFPSKIAEIYANCYDCFIDAQLGALFGSFSAEYKLGDILDELEALLNKIAMALNMPAMVQKNLCALSRLGILCPAELAFLIASIIALIRTVIADTMNIKLSLLLQIVASLALPFLEGLSMAARLLLSPFNIYAGCVSKSINSKVSFSAGQFGWTFEQIGNLFSNPPAPGEEQIRERIGKLTASQRQDLLRETVGRGLAGATVNIPVSDLGARAIRDASSQIGLETGTDPLKFFKDGYGDLLDPMEIVNAVLQQAAEIVPDSIRSFLDLLDGIKAQIAGNSINLADLAMRILLYTTLVAVMIAIVKALANHTEVCRPEPSLNADGTVTVNVVPTMTTNELLTLVGLPPNTEILVGNPNGSGGSTSNPDNNIEVLPDELFNRVTGTTFTINRCGQGKSRFITDEELDLLVKTIRGT